MKNALIGIYEQAIELAGTIPEEWVVGILVAPVVLISSWWFVWCIVGVAKAAERGEIDGVIIFWWW